MSAALPPGDVLSAPPDARFLRTIRRELALTVEPDLQSERSRGVVEMMKFVLDHLIVRQEALEQLQSPLAEAEGKALLTLRQSLERAGASGDEANSPDFEKAIAALMPRLPLLPEASRRAAWDSVRTLVAAERDLHDAIELRQQEVADSTTASSEQPGLEAAALEAYLRRRTGSDSIVVKAITTPLGGYSKDTFIASLQGEGRPADGIVIRRDLPSGPLESSVMSELAVIRAMHEAGVPVAEPLWVEADAAALGRPFIVVKQVPGRQLLDMKLAVVGEGAAECTRQLARVLARIHRVDPLSAGLSPALVGQPVRQHILGLLDQFEEQWRRRRLGPSATIAAGLQWMRHNIPDSLPGPCIVHGDATVRNMLFADGQVTAMLDWETWHLGDPGEDLAYCRHEVERFMPWNEFVAEYHASGGIPFSAESERYWGMWIFLRGAITSVSQMDRLMIDPPPDIRPAFGGPYFTRFCVRRVADYLLSL